MIGKEPTQHILTGEELSKVLSLVSVRGAARICRLLAGEHSLTAHDISEASDILNVSDIVLKCINPRIKPLGLFIACAKRPTSKFYQWSFYKETAL